MNFPVSQMHRTLRRAVLAGALGLTLLTGAGCANDAQTGGLLGAGLGALAGQAIGRNTTGTLIGTAIGAGAGYVIGNESDKGKARNDRYLTDDRSWGDDRYRDDYRYREDYRYRRDYSHREYYEWHYHDCDPCDH